MTDWPALAAAIGGPAVGIVTVWSAFVLAEHRRRDRLADRLHSRAAEVLNVASSAGLLVHRLLAAQDVPSIKRLKALQDRMIEAMTSLQLEITPGHRIDLAQNRLMDALNELMAATVDLDEAERPPAVMQRLDDALVEFANARLAFRVEVQRHFPPLLKGKLPEEAPPIPPRLQPADGQFEDGPSST
jgi:hypothetical protein